MDDLQLAHLFDRMVAEIKQMRDEEARFRAGGAIAVATYINHKRMGFVQAMGILIDATEAKLDEETLDSIELL